MGAVKVHEFISMDNVISEPTWTFSYGFDPKMGDAMASMLGSCTAILLGRTTYQMFYPVWSKRTADDDPGAPFFNETPKYVVSGTLTSADWNNTTLLGGYDPAAIRKLKEQNQGDIYVSGSGTLVRAMLADGLVDELHLIAYPLTLGTGQRLFNDGDQPRKFESAEAQSYQNGVLYTRYLPVAG